MERVYVYDGTFEGFLSAVFEAYERRENPVRVEAGETQAGLLEEFVYIQSDIEKAERVKRGIYKKLGADAYENVFMAFTTPDADKGCVLYRYLRLGFDSLGRSISDHFEDERVMRVTSMALRVGMEIQHLKGFIRFKLIGGVYCAALEPDNDVLELLAPFFADRFNDQRFIIEDKRRDKLIASENGEWELHLSPGLDLGAFEGDDEIWNELWRAFHRSLTIKERINPRQQRTMMPKRYWKYMGEQQGYDPALEGNTVFFLPDRRAPKQLDD